MIQNELSKKLIRGKIRFSLSWNDIYENSVPRHRVSKKLFDPLKLSTQAVISKTKH